MGNNFQKATPLGPKNTISDIWLTPKWIIDKIGVSDLDPCGWCPNGTPLIETAQNYFLEQDNGLQQEWFGSIYCNPPYSDLKSWLAKCSLYHERTGNDVIVLCFVRSETQAFQRNIKTATGINLINKRIKFLNYLGEEKSDGNAPSCLIAWGENAFSRIKEVDGIFCRIEK